MPGFDGTGPLGQGAKTGGGRGTCPQPVDMYYGVGRGGLPRGGGRGFAFGGCRRGRRMSPVAVTRDTELQSLQEQITLLNERITSLTSAQKPA